MEMKKSLVSPLYPALMVVNVVIFLGCLQFQMGYSVKNHMISWDDMKVDEGREFLYTEVDQYNLKQANNVIVVDQNGRGQSRTVQGAIDMVPQDNNQRVKIYILPGVYREKVKVPSNKPFISLIGSNKNESSNTVISWNNKASDKSNNGLELGTYHTATVTIESEFFCATGITFQNTVHTVPGAHGMQAVALRIAGDKAMFYKVRILGTQDTLLDDIGSHYFYSCYIQGGIDFIFGRSRSLYKDCVLNSIASKVGGAIAAHHRDTPDENTGFSFVNCIVKGTGHIYLGRAWGDYARILYSNCNFNDIINPTGWSDWERPNRQKTAVFGEYNCIGQGAERSGRVPWARTFNKEDIRPFMDLEYIDGHKWLRL